nr:keratinocyte-associated protein 3 isoform X4 [Vulpes vulpes]
MRCCRLYTFDAASGPRRLMRVGLALILVGHVNLLVGAVLHGTVLRHVANPRGAVTPEYTTANVISVGSGLLHWALLAAALMNLLLSAACSLGLLLAVSLTVANGGRRLIADCHPGLLDPLLPLDQGPGRADCPFDPTRIYVSACSSQPFCRSWSCPVSLPYMPCLPCSLSVPHLPASPQDTALALWIPSVFMSAAEAALSGYCCVAALTLRGVGPYRKEGLQEQLEELTDLDLPKCTRQENEQLLDQNQEIQASQKSWA